MKSLQDALYNWLTIKVVCDARPDDTAAIETRDFFEDMLTSQHQVTNKTITTDEHMYYLTYEHNGETKKARYQRELIDIMLNHINQEPEKYENYPLEDE
jgi:hypothetical protein